MLRVIIAESYAVTDVKDLPQRIEDRQNNKFGFIGCSNLMDRIPFFTPDNVLIETGAGLFKPCYYTERFEGLTKSGKKKITKVTKISSFDRVEIVE